MIKPFAFGLQAAIALGDKHNKQMVVFVAKAKFGDR